MPGAHAKRSPSSAPQFIRCPASPRLSEGMPDTAGPEALIGTAAHQTLEGLLRQEIDVQAFWGAEERLEIVQDDDGMAHEILLGEEDLEAIRTAYRHITEVYQRLYDEDPAGTVLTAEQRVHPGEMILSLGAKAADGTPIAQSVLNGTLDVAIRNSKRLVVADYKHGRSLVDAKENYQTLLYAFGAIAAWPQGQDYPDEVEMHIVQPRCYGHPPTKVWALTWEQFYQYAGFLASATLESFNPDAEPVPGEKQCQWCRGKPKCSAALRQMFHAVGAESMPQVEQRVVRPVEELTREEVGQILLNKKLIEGFLQAVYDHAQKAAEAGDPPTGFKLVRKTNTKRKWAKPEEEVIKALRNKRTIEEKKIPVNVYTKKTLKTPTQVLKEAKKILGPEAYAHLEELVIKPQGGVELVLESDSRPSAKLTPAEMFADLSFLQ